MRELKTSTVSLFAVRCSRSRSRSRSRSGVGINNESTFIFKGGAKSPFRPYGGSLFVKRDKK
ncbi:hypothetical protein C1X73_32285 [Pseudomonas sp. FW305-130]|nr:hypothetical protein C1X74_31645 [Pseudomonas sp. GW460-5]PNB52954.1 hypothetical protein C1X73_32285 [Pseudomonas sp. FW305-130]